MKFKSLVLSGMLLSTAPLWAASFDHSAYDVILRKYVNGDGLVDYEGIRKSSAAALKDYLSSLTDAGLRGWSYEERLAFWINAYNARMIQNIADHPELKKVSENFGLFDTPFKAAGGNYTLNDIESRIIRGKVNDKNNKGPIPGVTLERFDPRIHFTLVCAAIDCPRLQNFAYTAENLEKTLQSAAIRFASLPKHVAVINGRLRLSSLLKWYKDDFDAVAGVPGFLLRLMAQTQRPDKAEILRLLQNQFDKADYAYDWTVNDIRNAHE